MDNPTDYLFFCVNFDRFWRWIIRPSQTGNRSVSCVKTAFSVVFFGDQKAEFCPWFWKRKNKKIVIIYKQTVSDSFVVWRAFFLSLYMYHMPSVKQKLLNYQKEPQFVFFLFSWCVYVLFIIHYHAQKQSQTNLHQG